MEMATTHTESCGGRMASKGLFSVATLVTVWERGGVAICRTFFAVHFNILLLENIKRECVREGRLQTIWVHSTCREVHCPALANTIYIYNNLQVKMFTTTMIHSKRIYPPKIHTSLLMLLLYLLCISAIFHVFF